VLAHVALAARGFHALYARPSEWSQNLVWLAAALGIALVGRLMLSFLPPGPTGAHDGRGRVETWALSLALGWLASCFLALQDVRVSFAAADPGGARALAYALPAVLLALAAFARWITLPGAMVPRHEVERAGFGAWRAPLVLALGAWLAYAAFTRAFVAALAWLALGVLLERALARARRAPAGRALFLLAFAGLGNPAGALLSEDYGLVDEVALAAALACGAAYLVPWLRRADKRAGVLAALFFAAPWLFGWDPIALVGPIVLVAASHPRQRRFAIVASASAALAFFAGGLWSHGLERGRLLLGRELAGDALDVERWGLAWPIVLVALLVGAASFPWRGSAWQSGAIEEPRREALALAALVALTALALACPGSRALEPAALVILFPPCALLAGMLAIPPERVPG